MPGALNEIQRFFIEDTRLGVPAEFTDEGIRGIEHYKATDFPTQLSLGQAWDRQLVRQVGRSPDERPMPWATLTCMRLSWM